MTEEEMKRIIDKFDTDREFRTSQAFGDGGVDLLSGRLHRAALNQLCEGEATVSRYGIWANTGDSMRQHGDAHEIMRCYIFESVIWGNHAETIKDRQTGSVASYHLPGDRAARHIQR